jgi:hypothetical protein
MTPIPIRVVAIAVTLACGSAALGDVLSTRMPDGKQWTMENLNVKAVASYCYEDAEQNCQRYGRLYTWESAQKGCQSIGRAWFYNFGRGGPSVNRQREGDKQMAISVRCVKE